MAIKTVQRLVEQEERIMSTQGIQERRDDSSGNEKKIQVGRSKRIFYDDDCIAFRILSVLLRFSLLILFPRRRP